MKIENKILNPDKLKKIVQYEKKKGKRIVLCHGTFDLLHIGHIKHFKEAKKLGDILIVTLTSDKFVNKGPGRPYFNEGQRLEAISSLSAVDYVSLNNEATAVKIIKFLKPNIYCKGPDYTNQKLDTTGEIVNEKKATQSYGGKILFTKSEMYSSSKLINSSRNVYSEEMLKNFSQIKNLYNFDQIKLLVEKIKKLNVLVIGETIIDEYIFCEALGKSGKEPLLTFKDLTGEKYLGGSAAIARHISEFCNKITLLSSIGEKKENFKQINNNLPRNVKFEFIKKKDSPTIVKKRFIDKISLNKVFGVYSLNDENLNKKQENELIKKIKKLSNIHDLIIVSDYGHGFITNKIAKIIAKNKKFLAVNAQINSANIGYRTIENYKKVNFIVINQKELRHELRDSQTKIEILMKILSKRQKITNLIVTRGVDGAILFNSKNNKFNYCDAFTKFAVDKVGAGDAMLSITALFLKLKASNELSLLAGSLAASQSSMTLANKTSVNKISLLKSIEHILK